MKRPTCSASAIVLREFFPALTAEEFLALTSEEREELAAEVVAQEGE